MDDRNVVVSSTRPSLLSINFRGGGGGGGQGTRLVQSYSSQLLFVVYILHVSFMGAFLCSCQ